MNSLELLGFALAILIGILLSLLGGGGSILTVPVLVYLFGIPPALATAYSLLIVGTSSAVASLGYLRQGLASPRTALFFSFPSFVMVFLTRKYLLPRLPEHLLTVAGFTLTKDLLIMLVFAGLMVLASSAMLRGRRDEVADIRSARARLNYPMIFLEGLLVGTLTGFVGVGGGFLIIPVLTAFVRLPMKLAVGTSLMIIAINSLIGMLGDLGQHPTDWSFLGKFIALTLLGVLVGTALAKRVEGRYLKPAFGWFTLLMGTGILVKELVV
ncbi:MAG: sulfite exporter TauE/SafE family protein [Cytophagaceae bacterium]|nr:sulfite exporter TauE/SafE family protein [Cytophagaceae bacterium]